MQLEPFLALDLLASLPLSLQLSPGSPRQGKVRRHSRLVLLFSIFSHRLFAYWFAAFHLFLGLEPG